MHILVVTLLCLATDQIAPPAPVAQPAPVAKPFVEWMVQPIDGNFTIELPVLEPVGYTRAAPANYKTHSTSKMVPRWCPQHGYRCGMQQAVEDLAGHLQSKHDVTIEILNEMGRDKWADLHADDHWYEESPERQAAFLAAKPTVTKSNCPSGNCPAPWTRRGSGFF